MGWFHIHKFELEEEKKTFPLSISLKIYRCKCGKERQTMSSPSIKEMDKKDFCNLYSQEEIDRLESFRELILKERGVTLKKVILYDNKEEEKKWRKLKAIAEDLKLDKEHLERRTEAVEKESEDNLRDYEVFTVMIVAIDDRLEVIRSDPERFLKEMKSRPPYQMI